MLELTPDLLRAVDASPNGPITVLDPRTNQPYVLIRAEVYDQLTGIDDDLDITSREVAALIERNMREYDEGDPTLEDYQHREDGK